MATTPSPELLIVMAPGATADQTEHVVARLQEAGVDARVSRGREATVIGAIGERELLATMPLEGYPGVEQVLKPQPSEFVVRSAIEVNAPPEAVWKEVVSFGQIAPPTEMIFRAGIAYPIRAEISGHGVGAVRHCIFSTGPFAEPIEVWDEPRLLKFGVTANPAPLNELSPYGNIQPAHLHGYFVSKQGQFLLTALPGGRTRLEGATWYQHTMWPAAYWHLWSDYIIHRIHLRVLEHIRAEAERN